MGWGPAWHSLLGRSTINRCKSHPEAHVLHIPRQEPPPAPEHPELPGETPGPGARARPPDASRKPHVYLLELFGVGGGVSRGGGFNPLVLFCTDFQNSLSRPWLSKSSRVSFASCCFCSLNPVPGSVQTSPGKGACCGAEGPGGAAGPGASFWGAAGLGARCAPPSGGGRVPLATAGLGRAFLWDSPAGETGVPAAAPGAAGSEGAGWAGGDAAVSSYPPSRVPRMPPLPQSWAALPRQITVFMPAINPLQGAGCGFGQPWCHRTSHQLLGTGGGSRAAAQRVWGGSWGAPKPEHPKARASSSPCLLALG